MLSKNKNNRSLLVSSVSMGVICALTFAGGAIAQNAKTGTETVIVTGSRLQGKIERSVSPVAMLDKDKLLETATVDVDDLLKKENQFAASIGSTSTPAGTDAQGASTLDMRGMGQNRTLVLINGTRATPFGFRNSVDINTIPSTLIKRIEYLTGGASAVYGADAVAGVANFILNDRFDGIEVTASGGMAEEGDATQYAVGLTAGLNLNEGRGNITGYVGYAERGRLLRSDRDWAAIEYVDNTATGKIDIIRPTTTSRGGNFTRWGSTTATNELSVFNLTSVGGSAAAKYLSFNNDGNIVTSRFSDSLTSYESFINPQDRVNAALFFNYDLADDLTFWSRATISKINNTGSFTFSNPANTAGSPILIRKDNAFLTPALNAVFSNAWNLNLAGTGAGTDALKLNVDRSFIEFGPRTDENERTSYQIAAGLKGKFSDTLKWDFSIIMGHSDEDTLRFGEGTPAKIAQGANSILVNGVAQCVDQSNGCVPVNLFGPNTISPEAAAWVMGEPLAYGRNRDQHVVSSNLYGDTSNFLNLKGGPVQWSLGLEYRSEYGDMYWDPRMTAQTYFGTTKRNPGYARFDLAEMYTEVRAPILADLPFVKRLDFEGAYRLSSHSQAGEYENSKLGFNWQVDDNVRLRGSKQTVFRAPNVGELWGEVGSSIVNRLIGITDPCANVTTSGADSATCLASGAPASPYTVASGTFQTPFGGDPNMKPETGETYTLGFVATPKFIPGLTVMADYWNISLEDAIGNLTASATANLCYVITKDIDSIYCQRIKRDTLGQISSVSTVDINIANIETSGVDFSASYSLKLPEYIPGKRINFNLTGGWLENYTKQATPLEKAVNCVGSFSIVAAATGSCSDGGVGSRPMPEWRGSFSMAWVSDPVTLRATLRYFGEVDQVASSTGQKSNTLIQHIDAQQYVDLGATWRINENLRASLSVTNVGDVEPPLLGSAQFDANTIPSVYDVIGRRYGLSLVWKY